MTVPQKNELLRALPCVDELLNAPVVSGLEAIVPREFIADEARAAIDRCRQNILQGASTEVPDAQALAEEVRTKSLNYLKPSLRPVINASGVIIHTNLGRSVLAPSAVDAVAKAAGGYSTLEYNTDAMARGSRHDHCERLICALTGAEAAIAVNNNAAAVMMVLSEFAAGHEAVVSRGELVEIGGSFRIPDIMDQSNARLVEVGTTNKTHDRDYTFAITPNTAMLLKVHPSNYRMIGFTESVSIKSLADIAATANKDRAAEDRILVYEDQGSGSLLRLDCFGEYAEPTVAESLAQGADLVSFSGDKLLGGPQAGIIVGSKELIKRLKANPLARVLRLDKMTLAALEATLRLYLNPEEALREIPTLAMLSQPAEAFLPRAQALAEAMTAGTPTGAANITVVPEISRAGGGALPMCDIPTFAVQVTFTREDANALDASRLMISQRFVPVIPRIHKEALLFDARTLLNDAEVAECAKALGEYFATLH